MTISCPPRRRTLLVGGAIALLAAVLAPATSVGAAPAGSIAGRVVDGGGNPLEQICVSAGPVGAVTGADGNYRIEDVADGTWAVGFEDCGPDGWFVTQWYQNQVDADRATPVEITGGAPVVLDQVVMQRGGRIFGTVTDPSGAPIEDVCVTPVIDGPDGPRGVEGTGTDAAGGYRLDRLRPGPVRVLFNDCNDLGPYAEQWWNAAATFSTATSIQVAGGADRTGIDAGLRLAATIEGTVTDESGTPLESICVQATSADRFAGFETTDADGAYQMRIAEPGPVKVQFVDCREGPTYGGQWFGGGSDPASGVVIELADGVNRTGISAALSAAPTATVRGKVENLRGQAMVGTCVVAYLADGPARFAAVTDDGSYEVTGVGSGTWAVGFLECEGGDPEADLSTVIPDPTVPGVNYQARWWGGAELVLIQNEAPDPIRQGASLATLTPGTTFDADQCFGCDDVATGPVQSSADSITVEFEVKGLASPASTMTAQVRALGSALTNSLSCRPASDPSAAPLEVSGAASPLTLAGLQPSTTYVCAVTSSSAGVPIVRSASITVTTQDVAPTAATVPLAPVAAPVAAPVPTGVPAAPVPRSLSFTG